jgi:hypothetical protein
MAEGAGKLLSPPTPRHRRLIERRQQFLPPRPSQNRRPFLHRTVAADAVRLAGLCLARMESRR